MYKQSSMHIPLLQSGMRNNATIRTSHQTIIPSQQARHGIPTSEVSITAISMAERAAPLAPARKRAPIKRLMIPKHDVSKTACRSGGKSEKGVIGTGNLVKFNQRIFLASHRVHNANTANADIGFVVQRYPSVHKSSTNEVSLIFSYCKPQPSTITTIGQISACVSKLDSPPSLYRCTV